MNFVLRPPHLLEAVGLHSSLGFAPRGGRARVRDVCDDSKMSRVVCFGLLTLDHQLEVDSFPHPNEKVVALNESVTVGGPATNAAATAAVLGNSVRLVTAVGDGAMTNVAHAELRKLGIETIDLRRGQEGAPPISTVLVTVATGDRAVISKNAQGVRASVSSEEASEALEGAEVLLVDGHHLSLAVVLAEEAKKKGIFVIFDGGSWKPGTEDLLPLVDAAVVSSDFRVPPSLLGAGQDTLAYLAHHGCQVVAQSAGRDPLVGLFEGEPFTVAVDEGTEVVDTLGAGDVLHGALAHFCALGGPGELTKERAVYAFERATQLASFSCQFRGAHGWFKAQAGPGSHRCGPECDLH